MTTDTKVCSKCGESKPLDDFYARASGTPGHMPYCKTCDNARERKPSSAKINRMRARHRAIADLIKFHEDEFEALLSIRLAEAMVEAEELATTPEAAKHYGNTSEPVRLRRGRRMPGQKAGDRIDVARCPHCIKHHDRGHVCVKCGAAPATALRLPDDGHMDEIAVERAMNGDPVSLTTTERAEAIRRLAARGVSDSTIAKRLHCSDKTVLRVRQEQGVQSQWSA